MRDFRDAKAMAQTLRSTLATQGHKVTNSQSLELIAKAFGAADWNTLSAAIRAESKVATKGAVPQPPAADNSASINVPLSRELASTLPRALAYATQRRHQYATIEHLLLALIDDADASAAMKACHVNFGTLTRNLTNYIDTGLKDIVINEGPVALPTAGFRRVVLQRGPLIARQLGRNGVTGGHVLVGIFSETLSPAARCLDEQHLTREDVLKVIAGVSEDGAG
jgi:hypothetical protein